MTKQNEPAAIVECVVPHLRSVVVRPIPDAPLPKVGDFLYTRPSLAPMSEGASMNEELRKQFEREYELSEHDKERDDEGLYHDVALEYAFTHYQAGHAAREAEVQALRADAERYRFIRDADRSGCITREIALYAMESLDEAVDFAMENEGIDAARGAA